jgi:protein-disulfide isomerase
LIVTRRAVTAALSLTGVAALTGLSRFDPITAALANGTAEDVGEAVSLPQMALGPADASVTVTEYASITCPHCAAFNENTFPKIKAAYIDTGKIRYVFREFPLDPVAAASSVLSRCIAEGDAEKYFAVTDVLFRQDWSRFTKPRSTRSSRTESTQTPSWASIQRPPFSSMRTGSSATCRLRNSTGGSRRCSRFEP